MFGECIYKSIYGWEWETVLWTNLVQIRKIYTHLHFSLAFFTITTFDNQLGY